MKTTKTTNWEEFDKAMDEAKRLAGKPEWTKAKILELRTRVSNALAPMHKAAQEELEHLVAFVPPVDK